MYTASFHTTIDAAWLTFDPVRIGHISSSSMTPDAFVLVYKNGHPSLRVDLYHDPEEYHFKETCIFWKDFIVIGAGHKVYFVALSSKHTTSIDLEAYFIDIEITNHNLFVTSGENIFCFNSAASLKWRSQTLGIDGVLIHSITESKIRGSGEWDPPGGWKDFLLDLESGEILNTDE